MTREENKLQHPVLALTKKTSGWYIKDSESKRPKSGLQFPVHPRNTAYRNKSMINPY